MRVIVIRTDGSEETHDIPDSDKLFAEIEKLINARTLDHVNISKNPENARRFGMQRPIMFVDDNGYEVEQIDHGPGPAMILGRVEHAAFRIERRTTRALKPANLKATALYHSVCVPGTTQQIVGDVAIIDDAEGDA